MEVFEVPVLVVLDEEDDDDDDEEEEEEDVEQAKVIVAAAKTCDPTELTISFEMAEGATKPRSVGKRSLTNQ